MKLEVGMYARTNKGTIFKINSTLEVDVDGQWYKDRITDDVFKDLIFDIGILERVEKASHNIIDLIEVGDYVNGELVVKCHISYVSTIINEAGYNDFQIKSIVTREQFENVEYKISE